MGTAFKLTLQYLSPAMLLLVATGTGLVFLLAVNIAKGKFRSIMPLKIKNLLNSALMGLFNPFLYYIVLFEAYRRIPAQEGVALNYIWPVMLVLFSIVFLKQTISFFSLLAVVISFAGSVIIALHGDFRHLTLSDPLGVTLALGSAVFWASFWIINLKDSREPLPKMLLNFAFGTAYILAWNVFTKNTIMPSLPGLAGGIYIGIFEMGLTFVLWLSALELSSNTARVANLVFISPFVSLLLISVIIGERILISTWTGLLIIVTGILLQQYLQYRERMAHRNAKPEI